MILLAVVIIFLYTIYYSIQQRYLYWKNCGLTYDEPKFPYGNIPRNYKNEPFSMIFTKLYRKLKASNDSFVGAYLYFMPVAIAMNLETIKNILIKDFQHFEDRGLYYNGKDEPISAHLLHLEGNKWRTMRNKLTPTFTSSKMKLMFPLVESISEKLMECLNKMCANDVVEIDVKDIVGRYTTDIIGNCAFGIDCNSLKDPDNLFKEMGRRTFQMSRHSKFLMGLIISFPKVSRFFGIKMMRDEVVEFYTKVVMDTIEHREATNYKRNDFMDLLIHLKNNSDSEFKINLNEILAQAFVFFAAGYETTASALTFCLYELALNVDIQDKVRESINETITKYDGKLSYEAIADIPYLDQCIYETLRKYPPAGVLPRIVTKDYPIPNTNTILRKGTKLYIPIYAIHHDPEYYPNPEKFNPENFAKENIDKDNLIKFLAFGDGPRACIGLRFGLMEARIGLIYLLKTFKFSPSSNTQIPFEFDPNSFTLTAKGGIVLNCEKI
uniref:Putative cytochrome n=1 Tax=Corethrella appendiculata TaxID=1370023 RepID=U5EL38_9DIPT